MEDTLSKFQDTEEFLYALRNAGSKYSLDRIRKMCGIFGNPQEAFPIIHVAGTNGKGSVCAMLERILRGGGCGKVGMFTSPHLVYLGERVQINRREIDKEAIISLVAEIRGRLALHFDESDRAEYPSFFEYMTLLAFIYFARSGVDCAVVEVGLGGRLDSTNIVLPAVSVITSIGLDHIQILGGTIADIAREKAGIIKESVPAVCGWLAPEAIAVVQGACGEKHSRLYQAADFFPSDGELPETSLYGYYQRRNAAVALQTVMVLRKLAKEGKAPELFDISDESAKKALSDVSWAARWQTIPLQNGARLILDSSHNEEGAKTLDSNLSELSAELKSQGKKLPIISVGVLGRERAIPLFKVIVKYARKIILLVPKQPRALDFKELEECIGDCGVEISQMRVEDLYGKGLRCSQVSPGDTIVCTGSIYLAGEVLAALGGKIPDGLQDIPYGK